MTWLLLPLKALWSRIAGYAISIGAGLALLWALYLKAKKDGAAELQAEQDRARIKAMQARKDIDDETANLGPAELDRRMHKWLRD